MQMSKEQPSSSHTGSEPGYYTAVKLQEKLDSRKRVAQSGNQMSILAEPLWGAGHDPLLDLGGGCLISSVVHLQ